MSSKNLNGAQRISKSQGRFMVLIAIFFDFLALITVAVLILITFYLISKTFGNEIESANTALEDQKTFMSDQGDLRVPAAGAVVAAKMALGAGGLFFVVPFVYTLLSFLSTILAYMVFTIWFFLKGVNIWSFGSGQRMAVNMLAGVIEFIPFVNLLPGITVMVWRHVKISQAEDKIKEAEQAKKIQRQLSSLPQGSV